MPLLQPTTNNDFPYDILMTHRGTLVSKISKKIKWRFGHVKLHQVSIYQLAVLKTLSPMLKQT